MTTTQATTAPGIHSVAELAANEAKPAPLQSFSLWEGVVQGKLESTGPISVDCSRSDTAGEVCGVGATLRSEGDGEPYEIACAFSHFYGATGSAIRHTIGAAKLQALPDMRVEPRAGGVATWFMADTSQPGERGTVVGTVKVATLHAHGLWMLCRDTNAGYRKTFTRVIGRLLDDMEIDLDPSQDSMFEDAHVLRDGERPIGFLINSVKAADDGRYSEAQQRFRFETDGSRWALIDHFKETERDAKGNLERMQVRHFIDGKGPTTLTAKLADEGRNRFRLKLEKGTQQSSVERTAKAPLSTETWSAGEIAKLSNGTTKKFRYAALDVNDDDEPDFKYITLTRGAPGLLYEQEDGPAKRSKSKEELADKDELHLDARGLVTKEVSTSFVAERILARGALPAIIGAPAAPGGKSTRKTAKVKAIR